jgi:uncharacterized membrane protein YbhN (UPF0104 family)
MLPMTARRRLPRIGPKTALVLRWGVGLGLVVALLSYFDASAVVSRLTDVSWPIAGPAIVGLIAMHLVGALAWVLLSERTAGVRLEKRRAVRLYYAAQAAGSLTPSNVGGDVYRVYALSQGPVRWQAALAPVLVQRAASYLALLALGAAAIPFVPLPSAARQALLLIVSLTVVVLAVVWALARRTPVLAALRARLRLTAAERSGHGGVQLRGAIGGGFALALLFHGGSLLLAGLLVVSVEGSIGDTVGALAALTLARLAIILPITVSGLGFQEGALAALFPLVGLSPETALTVSLLNRTAFLGTMALGSVLLTTEKRAPSPALNAGVERPVEEGVG